jgi:hypothetical protein
LTSTANKYPANIVFLEKKTDSGTDCGAIERSIFFFVKFQLIMKKMVSMVWLGHELTTLAPSNLYNSHCC